MAPRGRQHEASRQSVLQVDPGLWPVRVVSQRRAGGQSVLGEEGARRRPRSPRGVGRYLCPCDEDGEGLLDYGVGGPGEKVGHLRVNLRELDVLMRKTWMSIRSPHLYIHRGTKESVAILHRTGRVWIHRTPLICAAPSRIGESRGPRTLVGLSRYVEYVDGAGTLVSVGLQGTPSEIIIGTPLTRSQPTHFHRPPIPPSIHASSSPADVQSRPR